MTLNFEETLELVTFMATVGANAAVAGVAMPAWRRKRLPFLALLAAGAFLGILGGVMGWIYTRTGVSETDYYWYWVMAQFVGIADLVLYAFGITFMVRHVMRGWSANGSGTAAIE